MKITVEIKNEMFKFNYFVGKDVDYNGSIQLDVDGLICFTNLLNYCKTKTKKIESNEKIISTTWEKDIVKQSVVKATENIIGEHNEIKGEIKCGK